MKPLIVTTTSVFPPGYPQKKENKNADFVSKSAFLHDGIQFPLSIQSVCQINPGEQRLSIKTDNAKLLRGQRLAAVERPDHQRMTVV